MLRCKGLAHRQRPKLDATLGIPSHTRLTICKRGRRSADHQCENEPEHDDQALHGCRLLGCGLALPATVVQTPRRRRYWGRRSDRLRPSLDLRLRHETVAADVGDERRATEGEEMFTLVAACTDIVVGDLAGRPVDTPHQMLRDDLLLALRDADVRVIHHEAGPVDEVVELETEACPHELRVGLPGDSRVEFPVALAGPEIRIHAGYEVPHGDTPAVALHQRGELRHPRLGLDDRFRLGLRLGGRFRDFHRGRHRGRRQRDDLARLGHASHRLAVVPGGSDRAQLDRDRACHGGRDNLLDLGVGPIGGRVDEIRRIARRERQREKRQHRNDPRDHVILPFTPPRGG